MMPARRRGLLYRPVRDSDARERAHLPDVRRVDAQRGEHQSGRVLVVVRQPDRAGVQPVHDGAGGRRGGHRHRHHPGVVPQLLGRERYRPFDDEVVVRWQVFTYVPAIAAPVLRSSSPSVSATGCRRGALGGIAATAGSLLSLGVVATVADRRRRRTVRSIRWASAFVGVRRMSSCHSVS